MGDGRHSFTEAVRLACGLRELDGPAPRWLREMRRLDADFYTAFHHVYTAGDPRLSVVRFEFLDVDLPAFLEANGIAVPSGFARRLRRAEPLNTTKRGHYRQYYDARTRDLVARTSRLTAEHGYAY